MIYVQYSEHKTIGSTLKLRKWVVLCCDDYLMCCTIQSIHRNTHTTKSFPQKVDLNCLHFKIVKIFPRITSCFKEGKKKKKLARNSA